jgi:hypothetical protein
MNFFKKLSLAASLLLGTAATAQATIYTLNDDASGYLSSGGNSTGIRPDTNYLVGLCDAADCISSPGEYRDYFYFAIPTLEGPISSISLVIPTRNTTLGQSPTLNFQLTSLGITEANLTTANFADLGTGTVYGGRSYSAADASTTQSISLNNAAITDLGNGGLIFGISGIALGINTDINAPDQILFGRSQNQISQLVITTVPVPGAVWLFGSAIAGLIGFGRRKSA